MNDKNDKRSVGLVTTQTAQIKLPPEGFKLDSGERLPTLEIAYETYGSLSPGRDNVVHICHALSGDAHVAGCHGREGEKPGWWDPMVGPGKAIDTDRFYVVCSNILGGCKGTTGPCMVNPATGAPYGSRFPRITAGDMVNAQHLLMEHLGVRRLAAVIGGSFGGMQAVEWAIRYPDMVAKCICIASAASLSAQALAFDIIGRKAIATDQHWSGGDYYGKAQAPSAGLAQARMIGHITYLSAEMMAEKFGREKKNERFQVENYLEHQGAKFVDRFDANSYVRITEAMDAYDLAEQYGSVAAAFDAVKARFLMVALSADWLFPPEQSLEIATELARAGKHVSYCLLHAPHGHDAFLVEIEHLTEVVKTFLETDAAPVKTGVAGTSAPAVNGERLLADFQAVCGMIVPYSRVLDLGCGDGSLLSLLAAERKTRGLGVDIDLKHVRDLLGKNLDVFQTDIDEGIAMIPDKSYDYVVLSQTLQVVRKPRLVLQEMLRVGAEGIVTFPNFAKWSNRLRLGLSGRMPKTTNQPFEWYDTPNIHVTTLRDFVELCRQDGIKIVEIRNIPDGRIGRCLTRLGFSNLGADRVIVKIARS